MDKSMKKIILVSLFMISILQTMAQNIIDVHAHIIPQSYLNTLTQHEALLEEGFPLPKWSLENQIKWMDEAGVKKAVLTLVAPQPYFGDTKESQRIVRETNEESARIKRQYKDRFLWCATLPLPDVNAAIEEAKYALDTLQADGVKLATNVRGQYLGAPELDTLMTVLNDRHAVVILHPHKPQPMNEQVMAQTPLAMQEYLSETTRTIANMITRNVMARYPNIKFVVPHCGAYLPIAIPRMKSLTPVMKQAKLINEIDWESNLASLYYDLAGSHSPEAIRQLLTITTPSHLLYGSDYPYIAPKVLIGSLNRMKEYLTKEPDLAQYKDMILWKNAQSLFKK